jgi:phosphopantetheine--protein transferase-like protein
MVLSCGIDIEEINRFDKHYFQNGVLSNLIYDIFTSREIENFSYFGKKAFLKGFCFKEAFYKAINSDNVGWFDIEILFTDEANFEMLTSELVTQILKENRITKTNAQFSETEKYVTCKIILTN